MGQGDNRTYEEIFGKEKTKKIKRLNAISIIAELLTENFCQNLPRKENDEWEPAYHAAFELYDLLKEKGIIK